MPKYEDLPYRPCAGLCIINRKGLVFIGRRTDGPEHTDETHVWQMPQGGIDEGETAVEAAFRELGEEVGTTKALLLRESSDWVTYDVPPAMHPAHWKGRWRGQAQKWFALGFTGQDSDIDLAAHDQEFDAWRWVPAPELPELIVPWKRPVYQAVLKEFADLLV